jgi:integrase
MWVEQTKTGKWKYTERYTDPLTGRQKRVSITLDKNTASSQKNAAQAISVRISKALEGRENSITLRRLGDLYLEAQKKTVKPSTYARNKYAIDGLCRIIGDDVILERLTAGYIKQKMLEEDEEAGTMNERIKRLKALLRWGYQNDLIDTDITGKLSLFHDISHADKIAHIFMTAAEYRKVIKGMERTDYRLLTQFLVLSGLRYGEAAALDKADVDTESRYIHISKTYDSETKTVTMAKTETSVRDVYIQQELLPVCRQINVLMGERKVLHGCRSDQFFHDQKGGIVPYFTYAKYLRDTTKAVLGRQITPHTLRHTHASLMFEQGVPLDVISRRLGHKNSKVTRDIYVHITDELQRRDNDVIRAIRF